MQRLAFGLARVMAVLGGIVLTALILLTCLSVLGRSINTILHFHWLDAMAGGATAALLGTGVGPVPGDFEVVEAGIAFVIVAFLPLCQISGGHAAVDIFTAYLPDRVNRILSALWEVIFALVLVLIAWRVWEGMQAKLNYGETTMLLQFPIWWAYLGVFIGSVVTALISVYVAVLRIAEMLTGRTILMSEGAGH